ncbi:lysylphosphatidylglycerol synthase domain-containing protein [Streptomyces sp. NPDC046985]|uniref:lysylphosphatidylglycerol synthase domain-containing protein n=1 Tax=Streptomyces sp. NPDC046985 TaxID=3155377 RepID=UPI0033F3979B
MTPRPRRRVLRAALITAFVAAACYGMYRALGDSAGGVTAFLSRGDAPAVLAGAAALDLVGLTLGMAAWRSLLSGLGHPLGPGPTMRVYGAAMLGKYLPGPFWSGLASVHTGRASGVPAARMLAAYALNSALVLLTAGVVGLAAAPAVTDHSAVVLALGLVVLGVLLHRPRLVLRLAETIARVLRRPPPRTPLTESLLRRSIVVQIVSWAVGGLHLVLIVAAVDGPPDVHTALLCVGGFSLASAAGMLVLVVPDGAGVREVVLTLALAPVLTTEQTVTVVVVSRMACTLAEVSGSLAGLGTAALLARARPRPAREGADRPAPESPDRPVPESPDCPPPESPDRPWPESTDCPAPESSDRPAARPSAPSEV